MGREGRGRREKGKGKRGIVIGGIALLLVLGCNNGLAELEKKNTFYESVIKIGQRFQEIFGNAAIGNAFGFTVVKSDDKRSKVGEHFDKIKKGLEDTNEKLKGLSDDISSAKNADTTSVDAVIKGASEVLTKLIASVAKLAGVTKEGDGIFIAASSAVGAHKDSVETIIAGVKEIIETAEKSGVNIEKGKGSAAEISHDGGPKAMISSSRASAGESSKLANEVAKADPWAMIDKIKNAKVAKSALNASNDNGAGELATGDASGSNVGAKSNADLAAAVALKAMIKNGKFSPASNEEGAVNAAATSAVNKVLGILDLIVRKTVTSNLDKIREAVKKIQYSETTGETIKSDTDKNTSSK